MKKFFLNTKFLLFLIAFLGYLTFLVYRKSKEMNENPSFASIKLQKIPEFNKIKLLTDTSISLISYNSAENTYPKIIVFFDGSCSVCFATLAGWKTIIKEENLSPHRFVFIGYGASKNELKYIYDTFLGNNFRLFNDSSFMFGTANKIPIGSPVTFLVDSEWKVLVTGNPFEIKSILKSYIKNIKK